MVESHRFREMKYLLSYPPSFDPEERYPVIVYLHGAGTRGTNIDVLAQGGSFVKICRFQEKGYLVLAPLCHEVNWFALTETLIALVESVRALPYVDPNRISLTGASMGGYGSWNLAATRPEWFCALMPLCGGGMPWSTAVLKQMPVRAFHGAQDKTVDPIESLQMVKAVNTKGGKAELILFPDLGHAIWDRVYETEANYDWLLSHRLQGGEAQSDGISDSKIYG